MSQQFQAPPRVLTALDEVKLRLTAPPVNGAKRRPSLSVRTTKNNVHMTVYSNVEGDKDNGRSVAQMDSVAFFMFFAALDRVITSDKPMKRVIPNKNFTFNNGERSPEAKLISNTIIEKEEDGSVYIAVLNNVTTPVKFYFIPSDFHTLLTGDGQPVSRAELTQTYARAWREIISKLTVHVLAENFVEPPPRENNGGGNWGNKGGGQGGNKYNGGGGGKAPQSNNNASSNFDAEMPDWGNDSGDGLKF